MNSRVAIAWTKNLKSDKEKEDFKQALLHDTLILGRLKELIDEFIVELENSRESAEGYKEPNWAYKQADTVGGIRNLKRIRNLLP